MKRKIFTWIKRYLPAEISAVFGALIGGLSAHVLFNNPVLTAICGTIGDTIFYYGMILFNDLRIHKIITGPIFIKTIRNILLEFGPAEFLDSFLIRPFSLYIFPQLLGNISIGLIVGKVIADILFYLPTIVAYELRIFLLKNK